MEPATERLFVQVGPVLQVVLDLWLRIPEPNNNMDHKPRPHLDLEHLFQLVRDLSVRPNIYFEYSDIK